MTRGRYPAGPRRPRNLKPKVRPDSVAVSADRDRDRYAVPGARRFALAAAEPAPWSWPRHRCLRRDRQRGLVERNPVVIVATAGVREGPPSASR
ncbi:unnamed protein product [Lampetra planeri]